MDLDALRAVLAVSILAAAIYGFVSERQPPDLTALLALLALLVTGVLTPQEAFAGFAHPATISVAAVLVLSAGLERTGALGFLARRVLLPIGSSELLLTLVLMAVIALLSAFVNNTAAVAVFLPIVLGVCRRTGASPGRLLMPMAHAATFGGLCTLMGTSTNLVAHEYARSQGLPGFTMFEMGQVGLPMLAAGSLFMLFAGRFLLPRTRSEELDLVARSSQFVAELVVAEGAPWIGRAVDLAAVSRGLDVEAVAVLRGGRPLDADGRTAFAVGDGIKVRGSLERLRALEAAGGLELHRPRDAAAGGGGVLAEVVVLASCSLVGRTLKDARFAETHDLVVVALHRRGGAVEARPSTTRLRAGDVLAVEGAPAAIRALDEERGFLVIGAPDVREERPRHIGVAVLTLVAVIATVAAGLLPIVTAATAGCAALMLAGCLRPREAYAAIDWSIIFLLAGTLALGTALEKTGVTDALAAALAWLTSMTGPHAALIGFFLIAMVASEVMSNSGTVALLAPVAVSSAASIGMNPMAALAAVALGASASFAMPVGYQTSLMIYGPGGYSFRDFLKVGIPLDILLAGIALWLIPRYWPLTLP